MIRKYPRTPHIAGSRLQPGDEDLTQVPLAALAGRHLVIEEKLDGANSGIRFAADGALLLQSRGHYLEGGARERQFDLFKTWAQCHRTDLWQVLGARYVMYGEWLYAKHTIFYDALPHYFLEFDVLDTEGEMFLTTPARRALLAGVPIVSAPVLHEGPAPAALEPLLGPSAFQSETWHDAAFSLGLPHNEMDWSGEMEGLYIKDETPGSVRGRYKFVRTSFHQAVLDSGSHWADRPITPNHLRSGVRILG
jgi:hypothetical protein